MSDRIEQKLRDSASGAYPLDQTLSIAKVKGEIRTLSTNIALTSQEAPYFNPTLIAEWKKLDQLQAELNRMNQAQQLFKKNLRETLKKDLTDIEKEFGHFSPMTVEAKKASVMAQLGFLKGAEKHFNSAARYAQQNGFVLESLDFRLQSALALAHRDWKTAADQLLKLLKEIDLEVGMRQEAPEGIITFWLDSQGDLDSMKTLRAEMVGATLETIAKNNSSDPKIETLAKVVRDQIQKANPTNTSPAEALALLQALDIFQRHQITEAQYLGQDAKLKELEALHAKLIADYNSAARLTADYPEDQNLSEQLGRLEANTFFYFWKEAGLPVEAIYHYMEQAAQTPPTQAKEKVIDFLLEEAPHLFDKEGRLLSKEKVPLPPQSQESAFIEETLHNDDASFVESLTIGTGTTITGATAGTKLGTLVSPFCGVGAPLCIAGGGIFGAGGGYIGGLWIEKKLHEKAVKQFVDEAKWAGLGFSRLTKEEAELNEAKNILWNMGGMIAAGVFSTPATETGNRLAKGLGWLAKKETWGWLGREVLAETKYTWDWARAASDLVTGSLRTKAATEKMLALAESRAMQALQEEATALNISVQEVRNQKLFEKVWERFPPWKQALGKEYWQRTWGKSYKAPAAVSTTTLSSDTALIFEDFFGKLQPWQQARGRVYWEKRFAEILETESSRLPSHLAQVATPTIDKILGPANYFWDQTLGRATSFGATRLHAMRNAIMAENPGMAYSQNVLLLKTELLRREFELSRYAQGALVGSKMWIHTAGLDRSINWIAANIGTDELARAHRFTIPPALLSLFHDGDGDHGSGWGWDGEIDSPLEFAAAFFATNSLGYPLINNKVLGGDIAGTFSLFTMSQMMSLSDYEGDFDVQRMWSNHLYYHVTTFAMSWLTGGMHYLKKFPLGALAGVTPVFRRIPSMTSFVSTYRLNSSIDRPNFFSLPGLALTLLYQSYVGGYELAEIFGRNNLINTDPYYSVQRGTKYAVVVPPINIVQMAFGYRSPLGQTIGRTLGVPADLGLAKTVPPFLNKGLYEIKENRLLQESIQGSSQALENAWEVFTDANTSLDMGGVLDRIVYKNGVGLDVHFRKRPRFFHWRWEKRGVATWTSPEPLPALDKNLTRKGFIVELAEQGQIDKIQALVNMYAHQLLDPNAHWHDEDDDQRGIIIFAFITKYFANLAKEKSEWAYMPFYNLTQSPHFKDFFDTITPPQSHKELLARVEEVDEGSYAFLLKNVHPQLEEKSPHRQDRKALEVMENTLKN